MLSNELDIVCYAEPVTVEDRTLRGYAVVFNVLSNDRGGYRDTFAPSSVSNTLDSGADVLVINYHDDTRPLARRKNGGLSMTADSKGLFVEFAAPKTRDGDDLLELVKTGVISGMSFGTEIRKFDWTKQENTRVRRVTDMVIHHVSPVASPAFSQTSLTARAQFAALISTESRRRLAMADRRLRQSLA